MGQCRTKRRARCFLCGWVVLFAALLLSPAVKAERAEHPFILWTREDAARIRKRIEAEPWAKKRYEAFVGQKDRALQPVQNLFRYMVMGDKAAGEQEKKQLLRFAGAPVGDKRRSMQWPNVIRYDCLYDLLSVEERKSIEDTFRKHVDWQINEDPFNYTKISWLPNMEYSRPLSHQLMALALRDEKLIRAVAKANGCWEYYMNDYLSDGGFYNEEFGKYGSVVFEMLLWCRGLERLGMNELGFGYTGTRSTHSAGSGQEGGATMQRYLESLFWVGYPRVDMDTTRPNYPRATMGDAKGSGGAAYGLQHSNVRGYTLDGVGGYGTHGSAHMSGGLKLKSCFWWELAHERWPDAGFDYFLAQMRGPDEDKYYPTLFFDVDPIDPAKVEAPPAPCGVYPERGLIMLRADESPAYWESPAPAVCMRLSTPYVHRVEDSFALVGFYALNRPLYVNQAASQGYAEGERDWSGTTWGHSTVIVDRRQPYTIGEPFPLQGANLGLYAQLKDEVMEGEVTTREHFGAIAKFAAGQSGDVYPDVDLTRALVLTREYMFDAFSLRSPRPRNYLWQVHGIGHVCPDSPAGWGPSEHLYHIHPAVSLERSCAVESRPWGITMWQETGGADPKAGKLGTKWFERRPGVHLRMLGAPGTIACTAIGPVIPNVGDPERILHGRIEPGKPSVIVLRQGTGTIFAALHEPYEDVPAKTTYERIHEDGDSIGVRISGPGFDDRVLLSFSPDAVTAMSGRGESFRFRGYAFVRVTPERMTVEGDCIALRMRAPEGASPPLFVNSKKRDASLAGGFFVYGDNPPKAGPPSAAPQTEPATVGPVAARWRKPFLALRENGTAEAVLHLRNCGTGPISGVLQLPVPDELKVDPAKIEFADFAAGAERSVNVKIAAEKELPRHAIRFLTTKATPELPVQCAELVVSHSVGAFRRWHGPQDCDVTVYAPRYTARFYPLRNAGVMVLLDPEGHRFDRNQGSLPALHEGTTDTRGRTRWSPMKLGVYPTMFPRAYTEAARKGGWIEEHNERTHQGAPFMYRFRPDWFALRYFRGKEDETLGVKWWGLPSPGKHAAGPFGIARILAGGEVREVELVSARREGLQPDIKTKDNIDAVYMRSTDREYGFVRLLPEGTKAGGRGMYIQPAGGWMAGAFCRDEEFESLARRWVGARGEQKSAETAQ